MKDCLNFRLIFTFFQENRKGMKYGPAKEHKNAMSDLTNIQMSLNAGNVKVSNSKFDSFMRVSFSSHNFLFFFLFVLLFILQFTFNLI